MRSLDNRIRDAFDQIHASPEEKAHTTRQVLQAMEARHKPVPAVWKPVCALAACLLLVLGLGGWKVYFTPTSVISVDINPSLEVDVNILGRVIALHGYNQDGEALAATLDVLHQDYQTAVDQILHSDTIVDSLDQGEFLAVSVVELQGSQGEEITAYVSSCTAGQSNVSCTTMSSSEAQQAHSVGLSYGKYRVYTQITAYDPGFTPEEASTMTMRELRDLLERLQGAAPDASPPVTHEPGNGWGNGNGNGNGNGYGAQHGNGNGNHG